MLSFTVDPASKKVFITGNVSAGDIMLAVLRAAFDLADPLPGEYAARGGYSKDDCLNHGEALVFYKNRRGTMAMPRGRRVMIFAETLGANTVVIDHELYDGPALAFVISLAGSSLKEERQHAALF
ncbi:MAG: hypothetical protein AAB692_02055 [Patescibacteria group bacterium]